MSTISEFLIAMESCYREYDSSAFIQNAKGAICGQFQPQMIDLQNDIYERNLRNSIKELSETYMDDGQCEEFFRNTEQTSRFDNLCNLPAMCNCDFEFRLNYLKDYSENLTTPSKYFTTTASQKNVLKMAIVCSTATWYCSTCATTYYTSLRRKTCSIRTLRPTTTN